MRRVVTVVGGFALLLLGLALLVLPGPGIPLVVAGLGLLSLEYEWARRLRAWVMRRAERVAPRRREARIALAAVAIGAAVAATVSVSLWGVPGL
ncbi:MAG: PGPGW domain-containing protein [Actinomycetota bacterium]